jgi:hypothetical protein
MTDVPALFSSKKGVESSSKRHRQSISAKKGAGGGAERILKLRQKGLTSSFERVSLRLNYIKGTDVLSRHATYVARGRGKFQQGKFSFVMDPL